MKNNESKKPTCNNRLIDHKLSIRLTFEEMQEFKIALVKNNIKGQTLLREFIQDYIKKE